MLFSPAKERRAGHNSWSLMICYNKQFRLLSLPHRYCTHSVSLYSDYIMNSFGKSTHLFVNILSPLFSSLSLPHPSLFWFSETGSCLPVQTGHKFVVIFLPPAPFRWDYSHVRMLIFYFENTNVEILLQPECILFVKIFAEFFYGGGGF